VHQLCSVRLDLVSISSNIAVNSMWPDTSQIGDFLDSWLSEGSLHLEVWEVIAPIQSVLETLDDVIPGRILSCTSVVLARIVSISLFFGLALS
jgi:hypothetical protein